MVNVGGNSASGLVVLILHLMKAENSKAVFLGSILRMIFKLEKGMKQ